MTFPATLDPIVEVSWDGSGAFDGIYDDVSGDVDGPAGLALDQFRDGAQQLSPPKIQAGDFELHNEAGTYSPERADSPLYQRVAPTRPVRYRVGFGAQRAYRSSNAYRSRLYYRGRGLVTIGRHLLDDLDQTTTLGAERVRVSTLGQEAVLTRAPVTVALMTNPRVDQCITALLDAAGWPAADRAISTSDTQLLYWWCDERKPWDALLELLASEGPGACYVDRDGVFHFENRNYRSLETRSTTSQATFWDREGGQATAYRSSAAYRRSAPYRGATSGLWFTALRPLNPFKNLYNRATYTTRSRTVGTPATVVWSAGADIVLSGGQTRTVIARPTALFKDAISPVLTTDYTVSGGTITVTLTYTSGFAAFLTLVATSGTPTISGLQLRATPIAAGDDTTVTNGADASASIAAFSPVPGANVPITLAVGGWPEIDQAQAEAVCDAWVLRYMRPRPQVEITLVNATGEILEQILYRLPSDRITLIERNSGISADFWINAAHLVISGAGGRRVEMVLGCERCDDLTGAIWDVSLWDDVLATWGV